MDWAIADAVPVWGVTALQAVEEMDAGPIWAHREFPMPAEAPRKSTLYTGPVADAAVACALEVVEHAADPAFRPTPLDEAVRPVPDARLRPLVKQVDRSFSWSDDAGEILRKIRAADGFPGVRTELGGVPVSVFDAHLFQDGGSDQLSVPGHRTDHLITGRPGEIIGRQDGYVLVAAGTGALWIGHVRQRGGLKLPATTVLADVIGRVPQRADGPAEISYQRRGDIGTLTFRFYNGAAGVDQCCRLRRELHRAARQDTKVLVLRGGYDVFCNGVHLNEISAAPDPATMAWENIKAINLVCRELIEAGDEQVTIAAFTGNAGAGGVMLGLGADLVVARSGVVLNPYYDIGLYGSELHSYSLPRRVGMEQAERLLSECLPIGAAAAARIGLVDLAGPGDPAAFDGWLDELAEKSTEPSTWRDIVSGRKPMARPLDYHETLELAEMARDMFDDRSGFTAAREAFVRKVAPTATPARLATHRR
ncbi:MAG: enoyl-CoA hydratase-related protein [Actinocatenispora sp.]